MNQEAEGCGPGCRLGYHVTEQPRSQEAAPLNPAAPLPDDSIDKRLTDGLWNEAWHFGYEAAMDEIVAAIKSVLSVTPDTAEGAGMHRMGEYVIDKIAALAPTPSGD